LGWSKKEKHTVSDMLSCQVAPTAPLSNQILDRFYKIHELKASVPVMPLSKIKLNQVYKVAV
jgi:hypothetical protein